MLKTYFQLCFAILYWIFIGPFRGKPFSLAQVFEQCMRIGVEALPMAALTAFSIGLTLAMQAAQEMAKLGAETYVPTLVSLSLMRELGPLLIAVIVIGRSGSAVTAELGTMKVGEEIEALQTMAINPVRFLLVPRTLAMMFMLPAMTVFGNLIGMFGGWLVCVTTFDMSTPIYILQTLERASPFDLHSGLIKSVVFAWLIISIACWGGMTVEGGAEGVGRNTTQSVVTSLLAVLVANAILTAIFFFGA